MIFACAPLRVQIDPIFGICLAVTTFARRYPSAKDNIFARESKRKFLSTMGEMLPPELGLVFYPINEKPFEACGLKSNRNLYYNQWRVAWALPGASEGRPSTFQPSTTCLFFLFSLPFFDGKYSRYDPYLICFGYPATQCTHAWVSTLYPILPLGLYPIFDLFWMN